MKKTVVTLCIGAMVFSATPAITMAETMVIDSQNELIVPHMQYIEDMYGHISISGTTATVDCGVSGNYYDATKAKVIAELQVKNGSDWIPVAIWTEEENGYEASVYETHPIVSGHTYRVKVTGTVWEGSASETQVAYSS